MAPNFHTPWAGTPFVASAMNAPLATLDKAITKLKNIMVGGGGAITYVKATGVLTWSATINIHFTSDAGLTVKNTIAASNVTLTDDQFAYVDLSETTATALTVTVASIPAGGAATTMKGYNRLILAWRDANDNLYPVYLHPQYNDPDKLVQTLTDADAVTIDWSKGSTAEITLDRATTAFTFSGAYSGQKCLLVIKQYAGIGAVTFGAEVGIGADLALPTLTATAGKEDILGFQYRSSSAKYQFLAKNQGY